jgi:pimeloyl-ACP methyl ester carboxylesterase
MTERSRVLAIGAAILVLCTSFYSENPKPGNTEISIRGHRQSIHFYPAVGAGSHRKVLFAPGDRGMQGFAVTIAEELARAGYDVYGFDTRQYLKSSSRSSGLSIPEIVSDFNQMARWIQQGEQVPVLLVGWSEGAGLGLAATANTENQKIFAGLLAIGTPEYNILAWHWTDVGAAITKTVPNEPKFKSADYISKVSPLPLFLVASTSNDYISPEGTRALFSAAGEPKRLAMINARDHKYGGNAEGFFHALREGLKWIERKHP